MHPAVAEIMRWLKPNPKLPANQQFISHSVHRLATEIEPLCEGPETSEGMRYLLLAKDCLVRASLVKEGKAPELPEPERTRPIERVPVDERNIGGPRP